MFEKIRKMFDPSEDPEKVPESVNIAESPEEAPAENGTECMTADTPAAAESPWEIIAEETAREETALAGKETDCEPADELPDTQQAEERAEETAEPETEKQDTAWLQEDTAPEIPAGGTDIPNAAEESSAEDEEPEEPLQDAGDAGECSEGEEIQPEEKPEKKKPEPVGFHTCKNSFFIKAVFWVLMLSVCFTLIGSTGLWSDSYSLKALLLLPMASAVLFAVCVRFLGRKTLWLSVIPLVGGAVYFALYAINRMQGLNLVISIAFCVIAAAAYFFTVIFKIKNRWILLICSVVVFIYRLLAEDLGLIGGYGFAFISFSDGMRELAALCMLLSVILTAVGLKRRLPEPEYPELPKIKTPHAVIPGKD